MKKLTFIIGLPGSGKTTLFESWRKKDKSLISYEDWMRWDILDSNKKFKDDDRYNELIYNLQNNNLFNNVFIISSIFCREDFLNESEQHLKSLLPDFQFNKIYFENNVNRAITNLIHRDIKIGGKWILNENNSPYYYGDHFHGGKVYEAQINSTIELSQHYNIPSEYKPLSIKEMKGPKTREDYIKTARKNLATRN